jgi:Na+-driven multidrug efflux pump
MVNFLLQVTSVGSGPRVYADKYLSVLFLFLFMYFLQRLVDYLIQHEVYS